MADFLSQIIIAYVLDLIFGDPRVPWHPVCLIGRLISWLEGHLYVEKGSPSQQKRRGAFLAALTITVTGMVSMMIWLIAMHLNRYLGMVTGGIMGFFCISVKDLRIESMKVYADLSGKDLKAARYDLSMIVGRDTQELDQTGVIRADVETVAEGTSDGIIAPLFWMAVGGPVLAFVYKAINTMDSMIGYRNEKYLYFGRVAARMDDAANFIPSRIAAVLMIAASFPLKMNTRSAIRIYGRDRRKHSSPNSAQTESVCAGALEIQLAGDISYGGVKTHKPELGDPVREPQAQDIIRANRLAFLTSLLMVLLICAVYRLVAGLT